MAEVNNVRDKSNIHMACQLCSGTEHLMVCAGCKRTWYCSKEHQKLDWKYHKKNCKRADKFSEKEHVTSLGSLHIPEFKGSQRKNALSSQKIMTMNQMSQSLHDDLKLTDDEPEQSRKISEEFYRQNKDRSSTTVLTDEGSSESYILLSAASALNPPDYHRSNSQISSHSQELGFNNSKTMGRSSDDECIDSRQVYFSVLESRNEMLGDYLVKCLNTYGICVIDNFLGDSKGSSILSEVKALHDSNSFTSGQLVNRNTGSSSKTIRDDMITWVDGREKGCNNIQFLISSMDAVILKATQKLTKRCTINGRTKAMVACYPGPSSGYLRHVDNPNKDGRCVTCIYYLNKDWDSMRDGGTLQIYPENESRIASIEPTFDRLLFFWSDRRNPHEVMQTNRTRYAITVWYYDAVERKEAIEKFTGVTQHYSFLKSPSEASRKKSYDGHEYCLVARHRGNPKKYSY